jgi:hypothetical protein
MTKESGVVRKLYKMMLPKVNFKKNIYLPMIAPILDMDEYIFYE